MCKASWILGQCHDMTVTRGLWDHVLLNWLYFSLEDNVRDDTEDEDDQCQSDHIVPELIAQHCDLFEEFLGVAIVAVGCFLALQDSTILPVDGTDESLQTIAQIRDMAAPFQVAGKISQCDSETGEHHHGNGKHRRQKSAILHTKGEDRSEDNVQYRNKDCSVRWHLV